MLVVNFINSKEPQRKVWDLVMRELRSIAALTQFSSTSTVDSTMLPLLVRCSSSGVYLRRLFLQTPVSLAAYPKHLHTLVLTQMSQVHGPLMMDLLKKGATHGTWVDIDGDHH